MHGYQHVYHKVNRKKLIIPYYNKSEFGGISLVDQKVKISKSLEIFKKNNIKPTVWVAPGHSFDNCTLDAIKEVTDIKIVSDGIAFFPYFEKNLFFVPQQLWDIKLKNSGIWTICLKKTIFETKIHKKTINVKDIDFRKNSKSFFDRLYSLKYFAKYEIKYFINKILKFK